MTTRLSTASGQDVWSASGYDRNARFVSDLGGPVLALLDPQAGEDILDLGCGDGALTERIATAGARVVGIDASASMVAAAVARGLDAERVDGAALAFERRFDAVFSNAALHWMTDPDAVIAGVARALRPGGRFVGEFGGFANVAAICTALAAAWREVGLPGEPLGLWYFPTPAAYSARLEAGGFTVETIELIPRPTPLPTGMHGWLGTFLAPHTAGVAAEVTARLTDRIEALLAPSLRDESGQWYADYVRLRFRAQLGQE